MDTSSCSTSQITNPTNIKNKNRQDEHSNTEEEPKEKNSTTKPAEDTSESTTTNQSHPQ